MTAPIIPVLTDSMENILSLAMDVGATSAGYVLLRLPLEVALLFEEWLNQHFSLKAHHVMNIVKQFQDGKVYDAEFHQRMKGSGIFAEMIAKRFNLAVSKLGYNQIRDKLRTDLFKAPKMGHRNISQLDFFS